MAKSSGQSVPKQVQSELKELLHSEGLPFHRLMSLNRIEAALKRAKVKFRKGGVYTPQITLMAFLSQVMTGGSCEAAVARVIVHRIESGLKPCSENTGSYCEARQKLPEAVISDLATTVGREQHDQARVEWKWKGRDVEIVDGSTCPMADTAENQEEYPQSKNQKPGLGFPILRFVVLISLSVGTVLECVMGACRGKKTGEQTLFRQLRDRIKADTILLGDRLYDAYCDIAHLRKRGVDVVFGMKQSRKYDFRSGRSLGKDDHIVQWTKPKYDASRYDNRKEWEELPEAMEMREARIKVSRKGFKTRVIVVVTSLLDAEQYSKADLMGLFAQRWHCELDLRSIKCSLGMRELKCKTPEMVRKELWMHLLAYNLIRARMADAAALHNKQPRTLSFQSAKTFINAFMAAIERASAHAAEELDTQLSRSIANCRVGNRPGRKEPRAVKKRDQKFPKLKKSRDQARKELTA